MQEAEVSLRIALYHIMEHLTIHDIQVSLDGAHIRTNGTMHFDIYTFMKENNCKKADGDYSTWRGEYVVQGFAPRINILSKPGVGDVNIIQTNGQKLYIESKKGIKAGHEYRLMREAIGQLMTGCELTQKIIPVVAVPYTNKSHELAMKWSRYSQMKMMRIKFYLVKEDGKIVII